MGTAASKPTIGKTAVGPPQLPGLVDLVTGGDLPTDVVLVASDGAKVGAHSFICASISPVMKAALVGNFQESTSKKINVDYASATTIEKMLSFAIGTLVEKDISGDDAIDLVILADRLDYESLRSACERVLLSLLTSNNAADLLACATECNCTYLAQMAKLVVDAGSVSGSTRALVDKKRELEVQREQLAKDHDDAGRALREVNKHIANLNNQIDHEVEEIFQDTVASTPQDVVSRSSEGDDPAPSYPHPPGRTLIALPYDPLAGLARRNGQHKKQKRNPERKKYQSFEPLVFDSFEEAVGASLPGDVIQLPKGDHHSASRTDDAGITKSIQIVGMEKGAVIKAPPLGPKSVLSVDGADVCIRNVDIQQTRRAAVTVRGGNLWLEDCKLRGTQQTAFASRGSHKAPVTGVAVTCNSSAIMRRCEIDTTAGSAVLVHLLADTVSISDCLFRGSGCGEEGDRKKILQGEAGAVEICDFPFIGEEEDGYADGTSAHVKLTLLRTNIVSCFGPALSYRTRNSMTPSKTFSWPGESSITMKNNVIQNNGLGREEGSVPDGEMLLYNSAPEFFNREPELFNNDDLFNNYKNARRSQQF